MTDHEYHNALQLARFRARMPDAWARIIAELSEADRVETIRKADEAEAEEQRRLERYDHRPGLDAR